MPNNCAHKNCWYRTSSDGKWVYKTCKDCEVRDAKKIDWNKVFPMI